MITDNILEKLDEAHRPGWYTQSTPYRERRGIGPYSAERVKDFTPASDEETRKGMVWRRAKGSGAEVPTPPNPRHSSAPGQTTIPLHKLTGKVRRKARKKLLKLVKTTKTAKGDYGEGGDAAETRVTRNTTTGTILRRETSRQKQTRKAAHSARRGVKKVRGAKKPVIHRLLPTPAGKGGGEYTTPKKRIKRERWRKQVEVEGERNRPDYSPARRSRSETGRIGSEVNDSREILSAILDRLDEVRRGKRPSTAPKKFKNLVPKPPKKFEHILPKPAAPKPEPEPEKKPVQRDLFTP